MHTGPQNHSISTNHAKIRFNLRFQLFCTPESNKIVKRSEISHECNVSRQYVPTVCVCHTVPGMHNSLCKHTYCSWPSCSSVSLYMQSFHIGSVTQIHRQHATSLHHCAITVQCHSKSLKGKPACEISLHVMFWAYNRWLFPLCASAFQRGGGYTAVLPSSCVQLPAATLDPVQFYAKVGKKCIFWRFDGVFYRFFLQ